MRFLPHIMLYTRFRLGKGCSAQHIRSCSAEQCIIKTHFFPFFCQFFRCATVTAIAGAGRLLHVDVNRNLLIKGDSYKSLVYAVICRYQSQSTKEAGLESSSSKEIKDVLQPPMHPKVVKKAEENLGLGKYSSDEDDLNDNKWKLELAWVTKALEPALQFYRWALPENKSTPGSRSLPDIIASIQRSKLGIQDWSLSDLTIGLYLVYLRQASANPLEDVKGVQIFSEPLVHELIYHTELARGCYKDSVASLARHSMLREKDIIKFVKNSSVMRPGYYIGVDNRKKLVILGIRGTHTVYDLITDIVSSSDGEVTFEGYSTHFGTAEAARWFLDHEMGAIKMCMDQHEGFRLRLVGHSLGAAIASLLAIMLRKKSSKELGFDPNLVTAVGYATPPCVSKELAESCSDFVTTVVMQDDIIPRLSVASLARLRNEILQTDWTAVLEKEDWKSFLDVLTNAKQVMSSVQDAARKFADYANFRSREDSMETLSRKDPQDKSNISMTSRPNLDPKQEKASDVTHEELFVPGSVYYLKRNLDTDSTRSNKTYEYFTLWRRHPGEHFKRILLSTNIISDHKCDSHILALRDVIKGLPAATNEEEQDDWFNRIKRSLQWKNDSTR